MSSMAENLMPHTFLSIVQSLCCDENSKSWGGVILFGLVYSIEHNVYIITGYIYF